MFRYQAFGIPSCTGPVLEQQGFVDRQYLFRGVRLGYVVDDA